MDARHSSISKRSIMHCTVHTRRGRSPLQYQTFLGAELVCLPSALASYGHCAKTFLRDCEEEEAKGTVFRAIKPLVMSATSNRKAETRKHGPGHVDGDTLPLSYEIRTTSNWLEAKENKITFTEVT